MSEQRTEAVIRQFPRQANNQLGAGDAPALRPLRLACGGAVQAGPLRRRAWWIEPLATAIAVIVVGGLIGFGLFVVGR